MKIQSLSRVTLLCVWLISFPSWGGISPATNDPYASSRNFAAHGVIQQLPADRRTVIIKHGAIAGYMDAMTMPFKVKDAVGLAGLQPGDEITFQLHVTDAESWVDQIHKIGTAPVALTPLSDSPEMVSAPAGSFMDYALTNELGQKVTLRDFQGQSLAITFFYTRCPLPDFCPRLSRNFQEAAQKLRSLPGGPTNWHFLSISFDTEFDSPAMLQAYSQSYEARPGEWSFLTGSPAVIETLARMSGVVYTGNSGGFQHNFRTLIVDTAGHLQTTFPMGGDLSDDIVAEIIKAAGVANQADLSAKSH